MKLKASEVEINGVKYVQKDSLVKMAPAIDGMKVVCVRSRDAGVHVGFLKRKDGSEVELVNSRRIWYWAGAATLSQLAMEGVNNPANCKFGVVLPEIVINGVCETISCTDRAAESIKGVKEWKK